MNREATPSEQGPGCLYQSLILIGFYLISMAPGTGLTILGLLLVGSGAVALYRYEGVERIQKRRTSRLIGQLFVLNMAAGFVALLVVMGGGPHKMGTGDAVWMYGMAWVSFCLPMGLTSLAVLFAMRRERRELEGVETPIRFGELLVRAKPEPPDYEYSPEYAALLQRVYRLLDDEQGLTEGGAEFVVGSVERILLDRDAEMEFDDAMDVADRFGPRHTAALPFLRAMAERGREREPRFASFRFWTHDVGRVWAERVMRRVET